MCIAIRLRDKGWPNLLITMVAWGKPNQTTGLKLFDRNHFRKKKICKRRDGRSRDTIKSDIINNVGADEKTACGSAFGLNSATLHVVLLRNRLDQGVAWQKKKMYESWRPFKWWQVLVNKGHTMRSWGIRYWKCSTIKKPHGSDKDAEGDQRTQFKALVLVKWFRFLQRWSKSSMWLVD